MENTIKIQNKIEFTESILFQRILNNKINEEMFF